MTERTRKQICDLLVYGYVREQEKILNLYSMIPTEIYSVIFEYELFTVSWNKEISHNEWKILNYGTTAQIYKKTASDGERSLRRTVYGDTIVKSGENFSSTLTITHGENVDLLVGLIPNKPRLLKKCTENFIWYKNGGYAFASLSGIFLGEGVIMPYASRELFSKTNDQLQIKFDWKENSLHYIVNECDFGNAVKDKTFIVDQDQEFELPVCIILSQLTTEYVTIDIE